MTNQLKFEGDPAYPLKTSGYLDILNWEIHVNYAIDANSVCWMDDGHGGSLKKVAASDVLRLANLQFEKAKKQLDVLKSELPQD